MEGEEAAVCGPVMYRYREMVRGHTIGRCAAWIGEGMVVAGEAGAGAVTRWFAWREVQEALAFSRTGGIALHYFRYDLRRFGLGMNDPACHILSADRAALVAFGAMFGLREAWLEPPRRHRPGIWHYDVFGPLLGRLVEVYPLPEGVDES